MITVEAVGLDTLHVKLSILPDKFRQKLYDAWLVQADKLVSYIKQSELSGQLLNVQSGALHDSIAQENTRNDSTGVTFRVANTGNLPYAKPLNDGCGPYIIKAVNAKALAFEMGGVMVFAKSVHHPGQYPRRYMEAGLQNQKPEIIEAAQGAMKGAWLS
jgi:hypothetical protein